MGSSNSLPSLARLGYTARIVHEYIGDTIIILATNGDTTDASIACGRDGDLYAFRNSSIRRLLNLHTVLRYAIENHNNGLACYIMWVYGNSQHEYYVYDTACKYGNMVAVDNLYNKQCWGGNAKRPCPPLNGRERSLVISRILRGAFRYSQTDIAKKYIGELQKSPPGPDLALDVRELFAYAARRTDIVYVEMMWDRLNGFLGGMILNRVDIGKPGVLEYLSSRINVI